MKTIFIETKVKVKTEFPKEYLEELPATICLATTVQFLQQLQQIKKMLEKNNKKVLLVKGKHTKYPGQILGCSFNDLKYGSCDAFLFVGDGRFHPLTLAITTNKPVFTFNPYNRKLDKIGNDETNKIKKKVKAGMVKFHSSKEIGVIVSIKKGQMQPLQKLLQLKKKFPDKNFYYLLFDDVNFEQLENFNFIECFVNTACPRIGLDDSIRLPRAVINIENLSTAL